MSDEGKGAALLGAQTGAFIAGAAASIVLLGPLAPVAVLGGAGVFAMYVLFSSLFVLLSSTLVSSPLSLHFT